MPGGTPLADTAHEVSALADWFDLAVADEDGRLPPAPSPWQRCSTVLSDPGALRGWQQELAAALARRHGADVPALTVEAWVRESYLTVPAYAGALCFSVARRVPVLSPASLAVGMDGYRPARVALLDPSFACLPDDPDARSPWAEALPGTDALAARLRQEVMAHAAAFLAVEPRSVRRSSHQLWGTVLDALDSALALAGQLRRDLPAGVREARLVLPTAVPPLPSGSTWHPAGASRRRVSCCYVDKLPGAGGRLCAGCPRQPPLPPTRA